MASYVKIAKAVLEMERAEKSLKGAAWIRGIFGSRIKGRAPEDIPYIRENNKMFREAKKAFITNRDFLRWNAGRIEDMDKQIKHLDKWIKDVNKAAGRKGAKASPLKTEQLKALKRYRAKMKKGDR